MRNRTLFVLILSLLIAAIVLVGALQPPSVNSALGRFAVSVFSGAVWFVTVAIPWMLFQAWVIIGFVLVWAGPAILARLTKRFATTYDEKVDPKHSFSTAERATMWVAASILIGMLWLVVPNLFIVLNGWYYGILTMFGLYNVEGVHIGSAIWALITAGMWFGISQEDGSAPEDFLDL